MATRFAPRTRAPAGGDVAALVTTPAGCGIEEMMAHPRDRAQWTDAQLLAGIAACDERAFSAFYRRHLRRVVTALSARTRDRELVADLTAEVFAAVMLAAPGYEPRHESASGWLAGIARNVLGHSLRSQEVDARARRRLGLRVLDLDDEDLERVLALADADRGPAVVLLDGLPDPERQALEARVLEERPYAEIAHTLQLSEQVVRKRVSRGLARLRAQLAAG
jgi:RNA polymerase sigma factor (sigma-70 family)